MLHIPLLRQGRPYKSLDVARVAHHGTREPFVEVSQANSGLLRKDLAAQRAMKAALAALSTDELVEICRRAADKFVNATLPLGDGMQSPDEYVTQLSATTGLPHVMARRNMEKIRGVLDRIREVLAGLTRSLDLRVLDSGFGDADGHALSYFPRAAALGVVLPSNSPGVHSLWVPAIALKTALILKPGSSEPWTPYRIIQAFIAAGCPPEAFGFYPTDHAGAAVVLRHTERGILFGDIGSMRAWRNDPRIELHGPGYSKVVLAGDAVDDWERYLDVIVQSISDNGGRSCVNASGVWVTDHAEEIAEAIAERLARMEPRSAEDPDAQLAPFADPDVARRISAMIDRDLQQPGARDLTAARRGGDRFVMRNGSGYLLPTVVRCDSPEHPLANREFLFPYASVVQVSADQMPDVLGHSLVLTALTEDPALIGRLFASPFVGRLNLGPVPTSVVSWDQPHEGNLFDHLYARRAFQSSAASGWNSPAAGSVVAGGPLPR